MTSRRRAVALLALAVYFAACLLASRAHDAPPAVQAGAAFGLGLSLSLAVGWWEAGA